jgi:formiminotetrahydrofolate cyclodeaminase
MLDASASIAQFLDEAAARRPAPGGGAVSALVGALAASMGEMVLNYSIGKKDLEPYRGEFESALKELTNARRLLVQLVAEDQLAFEAVTAAKKLPDGSPERADRLPAAVLAAIRVPEAMGATAVGILQTVDRVAGRANPYLLSDLAVCADLAMATARCSVHNVRANLGDVPDPADRQHIEATIDQILSHAVTLIQRVGPRIRARQG